MTALVWAVDRSAPGEAPAEFLTAAWSGDRTDDLTGVLYTGNPCDAATDEMVVTATRSGRRLAGCVVDAQTARVKRLLTNTPDENDSSETLSVQEVDVLARAGGQLLTKQRRLPHRLEWSWGEGKLTFHSSSRIVDVPFSWEEDIEDWPRNEDEPEEIWTHRWAQDSWNGATTPLHYSIIARECEEGHVYLRTNLGADDALPLRLFKYRRARAYYNGRVDAMHVRLIAPSWMRPALLANVHPTQRQRVIDEPLEVARLASVVVRQLADPRSRPRAWIRLSYEFMNDEQANVGLAEDELAALADPELVEHIESRIRRSSAFNAQMWLGFYTHGTWAMNGLAAMLRAWWPELDRSQLASTFQQLVSGLPLPEPIQAQEREELWLLGTAVRQSTELRALLAGRDGNEFFEQLGDSESGRAVAALREAFLARFAARGSENRDIVYPRRGEDPSIDVVSLRVLVKAEGRPSPSELGARTRARREEVTSDLVNRLRRQPLGSLKVAAFSALLGYVHDFLRLRDDQRHWYDVIAMSKKRGLRELGRRLVDRQLLWAVDDFYFLSLQELVTLLRLGSDPDAELTTAKIAGRRHHFECAYAQRDDPPMYVQDGAPVDDDVSREVGAGDAVDVDDDLAGAGTSAGTATGRARIVAHLDQLDRLEPGDILVCSSTDPGWTAAFLIIGGLVQDEGGALCPGACMAREHGIPAVTVASATTRVADGALIEIDGASGRVRICAAADAPSRAFT